MVARHDVSGLSDLLARLRRVAVPAGLPIAVRWPSGLIGAALVKAGHRVRINPEVLKPCRPH